MAQARKRIANRNSLVIPLGSVSHEYVERSLTLAGSRSVSGTGEATGNDRHPPASYLSSGLRRLTAAGRASLTLDRPIPLDVFTTGSAWTRASAQANQPGSIPGMTLRPADLDSAVLFNSAAGATTIPPGRRHCVRIIRHRRTRHRHRRVAHSCPTRRARCTTSHPMNTDEHHDERPGRRLTDDRSTLR